MKRKKKINQPFLLGGREEKRRRSRTNLHPGLQNRQNLFARGSFPRIDVEETGKDVEEFSRQTSALKGGDESWGGCEAGRSERDGGKEGSIKRVSFGMGMSLGREC